MPEVKEPLKHWQRVHICTGTSEVLARVSLLSSKQIEPGEEQPAQLVLEEPVVCTYGQRFIMRFYSPLITIGGGEIIFPYSYKPRGSVARARILKRIENLRDSREPEKRFEYLIREAGRIKKSEAVLLVQDTRENVEKLANSLISKEEIAEIDNDYLSKERYKELLEAQASSEREYEKLRQSEDFLKNIEAIKAICKAHKWQLITIDELRKEINLPKDVFTKVIQAMRNSKELALISEGYILISELESEILKILETLGRKATLAQVRDATGSTRKYILPILEYLDMKGYTRREGDYRVLL